MTIPMIATPCAMQPVYERTRIVTSVRPITVTIIMTQKFSSRPGSLPPAESKRVRNATFLLPTSFQALALYFKTRFCDPR